MVEELRVKIGSTWVQVDLNTPSGITLEYLSNLFGDISKINASHTYTFTLPTSARNRAAFKSLEDVRTKGGLAGNKLEASFLQDGMSLFKKAYLYVDQASKDHYQAVMTWDVIDGLQKINANDISLRDLPGGAYTYEESGVIEKDATVNINEDFTKAEDYSDDKMIIKTAHCPGATSYENSGYAPVYLITNESTGAGYLMTNKIQSSEKKRETETWYNGNYYRIEAIPPPVMPVKYLVTQIANYYGLEFDFGDLFNRMVVPFVKKEMTEGLVRQNYSKLVVKSSFMTTIQSYDSSKNDLKKGYLLFKTGDVTNVNKIKVNVCSDQARTLGLTDKNYKEICQTLKISGAYAYAPMKLLIDGVCHIMVKNGEEEKVPKLVVMGRRYVDDDHTTDWEDLASLDGEFTATRTVTAGKNTTNYALFIFDSRRSQGYDNIETELIRDPYEEIRFQIRDSDDEAIEIKNFKLAYDAEFNIYRQWEESAGYNYSTNVFHNLPDISCIEFLRAIMMAVGGYPTSDENGKITLNRYQDFKGKTAIDWTDKFVSKEDGAASTDSVSMTANALSSDFAQKNYYLMKNDELSSTGAETQNSFGEAWYQHSYGKIVVGNDMLDEFKTVYQSPFYGAFLANEKRYATRTYENQDYFHTTDGRHYEAKESKPLLATVTSMACTTVKRDSGSGGVEINGGYYDILHNRDDANTIHLLNITPWSFPTDMSQDSNFSYMTKIMQSPRILKAAFHLTEIDLMNLDYQVPVYLDQYNSNFAIKKITRNSDGICEAELIKLPNN